jgi:manganese transport protein
VPSACTGAGRGTEEAMMFRSYRPSWQVTLVPALLTAIAYVDPGNFGVNVAAGSGHRYALVWVVVLASCAAALIQYLAAKLGQATGESLAGNLRQRSGRPGRAMHWIQAEIVVMMTDLAEVVGGAVALNLMFGVPLLVGAVVVVAFSFAVLAWQRPGGEGLVPVVLALLAVILVAFVLEVLLVGADPGGLIGGLRPRLADGSAALLAVGIVGATVMPHALHFHSTMSRSPSRAGRPHAAPRRLAVGVAVAMALAGLANVAIMVVAVRLGPGNDGDLRAASAGLGVLAGTFAGVLFGVALLASGLASTVVSVFTGQVVLEDFSTRRFSAPARRLVAVLPALALLGLGLDAGRALVLSQVVLSFTLPGTLVPLVRMTASRAVMGSRVNRPVTTLAAATCTALIVAMDAALIAVAVAG